MVKTILGILAVLVMLGYLVFAIMTYSDNYSDVKCKGVVIMVKDSTEHRFVRTAEIRYILDRDSIKLIGKRLKDIDYGLVETAAASHKLISRAECFASPSGLVIVNVWQHVPIIRVMSEAGNYYLDENGMKTGLSLHSAADVVVASGAIRDSLTIRQLYRMALLLNEDPFWNAQIEQIFIEPLGEWILIPRVGDYEILFGFPDKMEEKLQKLRVFYQKGLPKVGWERYSSISLKFANQIVCTKKE